MNAKSRRSSCIVLIYDQFIPWQTNDFRSVMRGEYITSGDAEFPVFTLGGGGTMISVISYSFNVP